MRYFVDMSNIDEGLPSILLDKIYIYPTGFSRSFIQNNIVYCDKCGKKNFYINIDSQDCENLNVDSLAIDIPAEIFEYQEYHQIYEIAGYGAEHFKDGDIILGDLCEKCFKELLGSFINVIDNVNDPKRLTKFNVERHCYNIIGGNG